MRPVIHLTPSSSIRTLAVAAGALVLTACGGSGPHPGLGVSVAGEEVGDEQIGELTTDYCTALEELNGDQMGQIALRDLRIAVVRGVALDLAVDRFLTEYADDPAVDVEAAEAAYAAGVDELRTTLAPVGEEEVRDSVLRVEGATLRRQGLDTAGAGDLFTQWFAEQDVLVAPAYGVTFEDGELAPESSISEPVSEQAELGEASLGGGQQAFDYAAGLPADQTCGTAPDSP